MPRLVRVVFAGVFAAGATGCATVATELQPAPRHEPHQSKPDIVQAVHELPPTPAVPAGLVTVDQLVATALDRNPRLSRAVFAIDSAQGKYVQAGLYPNPNLGAYWDE